MAKQDRPFVTDPKTGKPRRANTLENLRLKAGDQSMLRREYDAAEQRMRANNQAGAQTATGGNGGRVPPTNNTAPLSDAPRQPRSLTGAVREGGRKALGVGKRVLGGKVGLGLAAAGTVASLWPDGEEDQAADNQTAMASDSEAPRTGPDGTPLPTAREASNPNIQTSDAGYAVPTGEGSNMPFGRTPEVQEQIDQNVAGINQTTNALRENNNLRRELVNGRQTGTNQEGSPEQRQIRGLVSQMQSGSIGDRNRNNVISQQIAALQGVDSANVTREGTRATTQASLREAMLDQQEAALERSDAAREAETDEARYVNEALADPEQSRELDQYIAANQAGRQLPPSLRSALLERTRRQGSRRLPSIGAFLDNEDVDPTNPSLAGAERISGGGWAGDLIGLGPGYEFADGTRVRTDNLNEATQRMLDEAIRRDNPRAR